MSTTGNQWKPECYMMTSVEAAVGHFVAVSTSVTLSWLSGSCWCRK